VTFTSDFLLFDYFKPFAGNMIAPDLGKDRINMRVVKNIEARFVHGGSANRNHSRSILEYRGIAL